MHLGRAGAKGGLLLIALLGDGLIDGSEGAVAHLAEENVIVSHFSDKVGDKNAATFFLIGTKIQQKYVSKAKFDANSNSKCVFSSNFQAKEKYRLQRWGNFGQKIGQRFWSFENDFLLRLGRFWHDFCKNSCSTAFRDGAAVLAGGHAGFLPIVVVSSSHDLNSR